MLLAPLCRPVEPKRVSQRRIIPTGGTASRPSALRRVHSTGDLSLYSFTDGLRFQAGLGEEGALESMDDGVYRIGAPSTLAHASTTWP